MANATGFIFVLLATFSSVCLGQTGNAAQPPASSTTGPHIGKCPVFPADNIWNTAIDRLPVDPHSDAYVRSIGRDKPLHPDFGRPATSGMPYNVVPGSQPKVPVAVKGGESDTGPVPVPANPLIEGGGQADSHMIVIDQDTCKLYELFLAKKAPDGKWTADSAAHYDLRSNALRPDGWTSADAAGLPIFPGLVRYEEVAAGEIKHAIRFTAQKTRRSYVWPGRHFASRSDDANLPPMGLRVRLRANYDISKFSKETQVILRAMKKYGMILSDNGSPWFFQGAPNANWKPEEITVEMRNVQGADFEAVDTAPLMRGPNSGAAMQPSVSTSNQGPMIGKCPAFPADNVWNTPVDAVPVHIRSEAYIKSIGSDKPLHPDFGTSVTSGIPYNLVAGSQPKLPVVTQGGESDTGPVPIPANPLIEGGGQADSHMIVIDQDACKLYELFLAKKAADGKWTADSAAHYDLRSNALRPDGWTSADAAGLPILPGLVRYEEVAAGEIKHAIRFTASKTQRSYVWPARHFASRTDDPNLPPMGLRVRLRANYDVSKFSKETQVILRALKKYGMILSDNGGAWYFQGVPNPNWKPEQITIEMRNVQGSDFEAVDTSALMRGPGSGAAMPPAVTSNGQGPAIGKCPVFPVDNIWNTPVDTALLDAHAAEYLTSIGRDKTLHPDFGRAPTSGIPFTLVPSGQPKVPVKVNGAESDTGPVPIPPNAVIEGGDDAHLLIVDQGACKLYELFAAKHGPAGWTAESAAHFDLRSNALRPDGWTSADAAGLAILPGLVRYEEVAAGEIRHALRFTAPKTTRAYVWPARHFASRVNDPNLPPMGLRVRLRADFDVSRFSKETQVILRALKKYGMILSDNGSSWYITGAPSPNWDPSRLTEEMRTVKGSDFEPVDVSSLMLNPNSAVVIH